MTTDIVTTEKMAGMIAQPHGEHDVASQEGVAKQEPTHYRKEEDVGLTPDKVPSNAPMWYQLAFNGSFATVICAVFIIGQINQPSATQLIDRTLAGQEKLLDRQERSNEAFKDIIRLRGSQVDRVVESYERAMRDAAAYHDDAKHERLEQGKVLKQMLDVNTRAALALDKIAEKK